jgi:hypothetical protein
MRRQLPLDKDGKPACRDLPDIYSFIWVSLRGLKLTYSGPLPMPTGNRIGTCFLRLPFEIADPFERMEYIHKKVTTQVAKMGA